MHVLKRMKDGQPFPVPDWITEFGNYNHMPQPMVECHPQDFWSEIAYYTPTHMEFRQVYLEGEGHCIFNTQVFWFHDKAFAVVIRSKGDPQFFRIGCLHQWVELSQEACHKRGIRHEGQCYHVYECPSCKTIKSEDSSD